MTKKENILENKKSMRGRNESKAGGLCFKVVYRNLVNAKEASFIRG